MISAHKPRKNSFKFDKHKVLWGFEIKKKTDHLVEDQT